MKAKIETIVLAADLAGTCVFAVEGAIAAMKSGLDLFGVMVVSFAVALGGGVIRDLLIGAAPPNAVRDWRYPALALVTGLLTFVSQAGGVHDLSTPWITVFDAAGLSLFAVAGTQKAINYGIGSFVAALMGIVTGVGGGVVRDILLNRVPVVLQTDIYASAAFVGGIIVVIGRRSGWPPMATALCGGAACFVLRMIAVHYNWQLPRVSA